MTNPADSLKFALTTGGWDDLGVAARAVRTAVFVHEQGIDASDEWDALDATAVHVVVHSQGDVVGTARLLVHAPGVGRIGRMAVLRAHRGDGAGRAMLGALVAAARARGDVSVVLHAQRSAEAFYAAAGFEACGAPFDEVGIAHIPMGRSL